MSLQNQLASADLEKRSKQLDLREESLNEREKFLEDVASRIEVQEKSIVANDATLAGLRTELEAIRNLYDENSKAYKLKLDSLEEKIQLKRQAIAELGDKETMVRQRLLGEKQELKTIKDDIVAQKQYLDEQERVVQATIEGWNTELREYQHEADEVQNQKTRLVGEIVVLERDKESIEDGISLLENKLEQLETSYSEKVARYREELQHNNDDLTKIKHDIAEAQTSKSEQAAAINAKELSLKTREAAVSVREKELDGKERRLRMNFGIAGIDYD